MSEFLPTEKADPIRQASTANFVIDSTDRFGYKSGMTAGNFLIQKKNSLLNGYFTRVAVSEVNLDWGLPNVYDLSGGQYWFANVTVDVTGQAIYYAQVPAGIYTVASALDALVVALNAVTSPAVFSIVTTTANQVTLHSTVGYRFSAGTSARPQNLVSQLGFTYGASGVSYVTDKTLYPTQWGNGSDSANVAPYPYTDLRRIRYIDIVSDQLTYNQALRDGSTSLQYTDILCRYYISNTSDPLSFDKYGFPIYPEYTRFTQNRIFPFPKQIRWLPNMPIGQVSFQVYADYYPNSPEGGSTQLLAQPGYDWMMTLQVSEV